MSASWQRPPMPDEGVLLWNVNTACNYRCSYCTQRLKDDRGRSAKNSPAFLAALARLPGRWEVKLSGGEPFVHPGLVEIVRGIAKLGHRVSVVTNFSASDTLLEAFVDAAAGRVGTFSASLHLEYVEDLERFADRAARLQAALSRAAAPGQSPRVSVTVVATRAALPRLEALDRIFRGRDIPFKVQPEREEGRLLDYDPEEAALIEALGGHNDTGALAHDFFGRPCWAGARFLVMDDRGEVYRCYPARRSVLTKLERSSRIPDPERERRLGRLGNFLEPSFRLEAEPEPCLYRHCYCTVPIARSMMAHERVGGLT